MTDVPEERKEQIEQKKIFKDKIEENFPEIKALNMFLFFFKKKRPNNVQ